MAAQTIGGLFKDQSRGEKALTELQKAGFTSAQISEVADSDEAALPPPKKLSNPVTDFFQDHTTTGSDFRDSLTELGMSSADAQYFEDGVARGGALVTVKADSRASEAVAILQQNGADLGSQGRTATTAATTAVPVAAATGLTTRPPVEGDQTIQLRAERLAIDKVRVASGAVRIRKEVVTQQQNVDVVVAHDELVIERHAVTDGAVGGVIGDEKTITVPLSREEIKVSKDTFVTEEVEIGKRAVTNTEHVAETVRHEELVVNAPDKVNEPIR